MKATLRTLNSEYMRERELDEAWLREVIKQQGIEATIYIAPNHYDGGYEVRVETADVFVDYPTIDAKDTGWLKRLTI